MLGNENILTTLLLIPVIGAVIILLMPGASRSVVRAVALIATLFTFICSLPLMVRFDSAAEGMQFVKNILWFQAGGFEVHYHVGIDGISLFLILMTTLWLGSSFRWT
jgi:NADH-quinone oxidoreductase subunit M